MRFYAILIKNSCIILQETGFYISFVSVLPPRTIMLKKERQAFILHNVNLHNRVLSSDLSTAINVSEDTIRRDLQELAEHNKLIKVHGGALSKSFHSSFNSSKVYAIEIRKKLLKKQLIL